MKVKERRALTGLLEELSSIHHRREGPIGVLQVGACDGRQFDPIFAFLHNHQNATGVFVEPMIEQFQALIENHKSLSGSVFLNVAVSDFDGAAEIRYVEHKALQRGLVPSWAVGISTIDQGKNAIDGALISAENFDKIRPHISTRTVPVVSINSLLQIKQCRETAAYISDCEGHDARILLAMDMNLYRPAVIFAESMLMSQSEKREVLEKLARYGYAVTEDDADLLAVGHQA